MDSAWLIPAFPFAGFVLNGLWGRRLSRKQVGMVACGAMALAFATALGLFWLLLRHSPDQRVWEPVYYTWMAVGDFSVNASFLLDPLTMVMVLVVTGVGFLIHIYSTGYMHDDPGYARYFAYLNLFACAMLILVLAGNLLVLFVGWEGVGLCSYLLIGFWYEKQSASDAGKKAFIVNRIGDFGFLLAIFLTFWTFGTLDFREIFHAALLRFQPGDGVVTAITLLLFVGAVGKSAQLPLYVWLPDAMEGPTPVSALIHAATMVTAGVYMVARCSVLYALAPLSMGVVAAVGCATAVFAATIGLVQNDIKRVLAYSTVSQLGYMFLGCGVGAYVAGIFHLMTHAFFKALLFLGAGSVIHALGGEQDIRRMGGLRRQLPVTFWTFLAASLAISGIVPFAGFFSKDEILFETLVTGHGVLYVLALGGAALTAFYMFRLVFRTFLGESHVDPESAHHVHEAPLSMAVPLMVLAVLSLVGGWVQVPMLENGKRLGRFLAPVFEDAEGLLTEGTAHGSHASLWTEGVFMALSVVVALAGIGLAYRWYVADPTRPERVAARFSRAYRWLLNKYYVDELYQAVVVELLKRLAETVHEWVDRAAIDAVVDGAGAFFRHAGTHLRRIQTGLVQHYALSILAGACLLILAALAV
ncbi:NADH dehydrogenase subunit L [Desulfacinum hydrothermale DSM 13146]|uniref:NADH dehydrogenase subunit L n=1 Tax=Desulfacinum hydrothermale DSM 13146 TaxID=1121390 RepID=A0A1W1X8Y9_9BACT|nr:NADH-quinone oxidoreductase subunit L [Desulfacinum hydrothermale]SMC20333.1 NADH dehydrogenase subunit L [Desulfacinum hydrothermale DSM 13146]